MHSIGPDGDFISQHMNMNHDHVLRTCSISSFFIRVRHKAYELFEFLLFPRFKASEES